MEFLRPKTTRLWLHLAFWGAWIGLWVNGFNTELPAFQAAWMALVVALAYALIVYLNLRLAIPRFLLSGRFGWYALFLSVLLPAGGLLIWQLSLRLHLPLINQESPPALAYLSATLNTMFMVFLTSSLKLVLHSLEQQQLTRQLENQQLHTELNFLKSQVNPHFLFNTLNNLYALALNKSDRAPEVVLKLSGILRYMLYECNERMVFLNKEIDYLQNYIELEELRQDQPHTIQLRVQGNSDRKRIAPLLFTPLLENAIKHGLNKTTGNAWVRMQLRIEGMELEFHILNSKSPGSAHHPATVSAESPADPSTGGGIGLLNVKRRLDLMYPDRHAFSVVDGPETYSVTLKLTLDE